MCPYSLVLLLRTVQSHLCKSEAVNAPRGKPALCSFLMMLLAFLELRGCEHCLYWAFTHTTRANIGSSAAQLGHVRPLGLVDNRREDVSLQLVPKNLQRFPKHRAERNWRSVENVCSSQYWGYGSLGGHLPSIQETLGSISTATKTKTVHNTIWVRT